MLKYHFMYMKKYLFISLLALGALLMTSCERNEPQLKKQSIYLEVPQSDWKYDSDIMQFYVRFSVPEITASIFNYGNYSIHREYNTGTADVCQVGLPQTIFVLLPVENPDGTPGEYYYQQLVDYKIGVGYVEIQVTNSDFLYEEDKLGYLVNPESMMFHLQLTY